MNQYCQVLVRQPGLVSRIYVNNQVFRFFYLPLLGNPFFSWMAVKALPYHTSFLDTAFCPLRICPSSATGFLCSIMKKATTFLFNGQYSRAFLHLQLQYNSDFMTVLTVTYFRQTEINVYHDALKQKLRLECFLTQMQLSRHWTWLRFAERYSSFTNHL